MEWVRREDRVMVHSEDAGPGRRVRRWRSVSEKRQIVQLTMEPGASVAEVARTHGLNANHLFKWRRAFQRGELVESGSALLPVTVAASSQPESEVADRRSPGQPDPRSTAMEPGALTPSPLFPSRLRPTQQVSANKQADAC